MGWNDAKFEFTRTSKGLKCKRLTDDVSVADLNEDLSGIDCHLNIESGWLWVVDPNHNKVYKINDYHFNRIDELKEKKEVLFSTISIKPDELNDDY